MTNRPVESSVSEVITRRRVLSAIGIGVGTAVAGCSSDTGTPTPRPEEATITIQLQNRDDRAREFEVVVNQGESLTDSFSGTLPANQSVEMVATVRATDEQHDFTINTTGGQRGQTWEPTECGDFLVNAFVENGSPEFDTECRSN